MKKHLIAAAVAGAFAVPAMAQVNISGNLNINALQNAKTTTQSVSSGSATRKTSNTGMKEGWTASQISFSGEEDLGGGLKASFTVNQRLNGSSGATGADPQSVMGGRDTNIAVSGGFGTFRFGRFIPASAGYHGYTGARTTNQQGNLYGGIITGYSAAGNTALNNNPSDAANFERQNALLQYTSPSISGLTLNVSYGLAGDDSNAATSLGDADASQTGVSAVYAAGPLSVGLGLNNQETNTEGTALTRTSRETDLNWVGVSYNLGVASVTAAQIRREGKLATGTGAAVTFTDTTLNALGISVPMGAMTIGASTYSGENTAGPGTSDDLDLSGYQVSLTYSLSKRTVVYAAMGENKSKRDSGNTTGVAVKQSSNAIGVMHSF